MEPSSTSSQSKAVGAAIAVTAVIAFAWLFVLPKRVSTNTHSDLSSSSAALGSEFQEAVERTQETQAAFDASIEEERAELEAEAERQRQAQEALSTSRKELEAQGFSTTVPDTDSRD